MFSAYCDLESIPADFPACALTIGNFDGVHLGHRKILETTVRNARQAQIEAVVLTFDPHPMKVVAPDRAPALLTSPGQRLALFEQYGFDRAVVLAFSPDVVCLSPEQFVRKVLVEGLHVRHVVVGENFRFGHRGAGNFQALQEMGRRFGFGTEAVAAVSLGGEPVSSTRVRQLVRSGRVDLARRLLGRPFAMRGQIVSGAGIGSRSTVPTLNLKPESDLLPAQGVYVTSTCDLDSERHWKSVTNVGHRPTFNGSNLSIETFLLGSLEGETPRRIELAFHWHLREEKRFDSAESLRRQILADAARAGRFFRLLETAGRKLPA